MDYIVNQCSIVILAAGGSSRLGTPKQLLHYDGKSLLRHAAYTALKTKINPIVIVVGASHLIMEKEVEETGVEIIYNQNWHDGIASSLRVGLKAVLAINPGTDGIIFMVCDQPYVTIPLLKDLLLKQHASKLPIVASDYGNDIGTPALFHKFFFTELIELKGDAGAKKLLKTHRELVATVLFPNGNIDIDTVDDYQSLLAGKYSSSK